MDSIILRNLFHLKIFHDLIVSCGGLLLTKWASALSLIPMVSFKSKLVLKLTGYIPAPALKGLGNPWKGSVQKVEFKRALTVVSSPCLTRKGQPGHEKAIPSMLRQPKTEWETVRSMSMFQQING